MAHERTAAQALYPHLPSGERAERAKGGPSLANSMYPSLSWEAKWWEEWRKRQRDNLVRGLREANANLRKESGR